MRKTILTAALLAALLLTGCLCRQPGESPDSAPDAEFDRIAARLQSGGSYYRIATPDPLFLQMRRIARATGHALRHSKLPEETKTRYLRLLTFGELVVHLAGVAEIEGIGSSSVPCGNGSRFFDNRSFLAVSRNSEGFLWRLFGSGNPVPKSELENLPGNTIAAACFEFHPEIAFRILTSAESLRGSLDNALGLFGGVENLRKLLEGTGGRWRFLLCAGPQGETQFAFSIPDREGRLFALLAALAAPLPGARTETQQIEFPTLRETPFRLAPFFTRSGDRLNGSSERLCAPQEGRKKLGESAEFRRLAQNLPEEGIGFFYTGSNYGKLAGRNLEELGFDFDANLLKPVQFTVLRREADGFLAVSRSNWEYGQLEFFEDSLLPAALFAGAAAPLFSAEPAAPPEHRAECRDQLEEIGRALRHYAEFHNGNYPQQPDIDGFRELLSSGYFKPDLLICPDAAEDQPAPDAAHLSYENLSYLYLEGAKFEKDSRIPVVIDWPYNHRDAFNVLFADGSVETMELEDPGCCKRIISALHARYGYPEEEFRRLIRQAERIDKLFELE